LRAAVNGCGNNHAIPSRGGPGEEDRVIGCVSGGAGQVFGFGLIYLDGFTSSKTNRELNPRRSRNMKKLRVNDRDGIRKFKTPRMRELAC